MMSFLLEQGSGFSFVAHQKRILINDKEFLLDLLMYNRQAWQLVAVNLKIGEFKASYTGQMVLYFAG